jgi:hypothetical protein
MCRYRLFRKEWKRFYKTIRTEFEADVTGTVWMQQTEAYQPSMDRWFCRCEAYRRSAYHNCKHLVRLYVGPEGMISNKPPMPGFGEVYRQSTNPILWIKGVHLEDRLTERGLQPEPIRPPIANPGFVTGSGNAFDDDADVDPATDDEIFQSEGEEEVEGEEMIVMNNEEEALAFDGLGDEAESDSDEDGRNDLFQGFDFGGFGHEDEDEDEDEQLERQIRGDKIKEEVELLLVDLELVTRQLGNLLKYPAGHPHLTELPRFQPGNMVAVLAWAKRSEALDRVHNFPTTWGSNRAGNVHK